MEKNKNTEKDPMINISGMWAKEDKNGQVYYTGSLGGARLMMFKNNKKQNDNSPDYTLCVTPARKKEEKSNSEIPF